MNPDPQNGCANVRSRGAPTQSIRARYVIHPMLCLRHHATLPTGDRKRARMPRLHPGLPPSTLRPELGRHSNLRTSGRSVFYEWPLPHHPGLIQSASVDRNHRIGPISAATLRSTGVDCARSGSDTKAKWRAPRPLRPALAHSRDECGAPHVLQIISVQP